MIHKDLARTCRAAYKASTFKTNGVEFFVITRKDKCIIAIRGTEPNLIDIIRNLAWWPKSLGATDGHAGYVHGWNKISKAVEDVINLSMIKVPVTLTGHSMGGAIAVIGAMDLLEKGIAVKEVVTFGSPKVIEESDPQIEAITTQYAHYRDPVPSWLGFAYEHVNRVYLGDDESSPWYKKWFKYHRISEYIKVL